MDELKNNATLVYTGELKDIKENYINLNSEIKTQFIRIEFTEGYEPKASRVDENVACCSEFDFFADKVTNFDKTIKSSYLELDGAPIEENTEDKEAKKAKKELEKKQKRVLVFLAISL